MLCADSLDLWTFCETTLKEKKPANQTKTKHASWDFCFSAEQVAELKVHQKGNLPGKPVLSEANPATLKM